MRRIEERAPDGLPQQRNGRGWVEETRTYQFVTPVFGGGVRVEGHHKPYDPRTPVRVASIRGQLRFWWRAVNPQRCVTPAQLLSAEKLVFGGVAVRGASAPEGVVEIRLSAGAKAPLPMAVFRAEEKPDRRDPQRMTWMIKPSTELENELGEDWANAIAYGAFSLRDTRRVIHPVRPDHAVLHRHAEPFSLAFRYKDEELPTWDGMRVLRGAQLQAALWAWSHFGGLGARTRRGFGAVSERLVSGQTVSPDLAAGWTHWRLEDAPTVEWPHLRGALREAVYQGGRGKLGSGLRAQAFLLRNLQILRQGSSLEQVGRNWRGFRDAGRSHWPEGDEIRRLSFHDPRHAPRDGLTGFPRFLFGLPIVFHFKDGPGEGRPGRRNFDPADSQLVPEGKTRFASPLILRPYEFPPVGTQPPEFEARAVRLHGKAFQTLQLTGGVAAIGIPTDRFASGLEPFKLAPAAADVIDLYLQLLRTR
jgi:CRISPR-associated protein Cmr1